MIAAIDGSSPGSPLTRGFWQAADQHQLVRPVCGECGRSFFTPQLACPYCLATGWSYQPSAGTGELYSYAVVRRPPVPGMAVPYVLAIVDLDEGWSMLTNLVGCEPDAARIGMRVVVDWRAEPPRTVPVFRPDDEAATCA